MSTSLFECSGIGIYYLEHTRQLIGPPSYLMYSLYLHFLSCNYFLIHLQH